MSELFHIGKPHDGMIPHSGRYPYGSGDDPYQRGGDFYHEVVKLRSKGFTDTEIVERLGLKSTGELRAKFTISKDEFKAAQKSWAMMLHDKGLSNTAIAEKLDVTEGTIRNYLDPEYKETVSKTKQVADLLKQQIEKKTYLDVGTGVEKQIGESKEQLKAAIHLLEEEGYKKHYLQVEQATNPGKYTSVKVLTKGDISTKDVFANRDKIESITGVYDNGKLLDVNTKDPIRIDPNKIQVVYAEDGGTHKDGLIELRPGVDYLSMGNNTYGQVRIAVKGDVYLKGMAVYNPNLPNGVDVRFNTNKTKDVPLINPDNSKNQVLKKMKDDPDNPFGSTIRKQFRYLDNNGKEQLSAINVVNDEEEWGKWSVNLASQFLSKQNPKVAERQLNIDLERRKAEFDTINSVTNSAIKKRLLTSFADECDAAAVNLKAAAFPRQSTKVILPIDSLKETEVYAPQLKNGEEVVLIRYPHGGIFEIPRLIVNNKNKEGKQVIGQAERAIGINYKVAEQLSGADFDGDTVVVIPTNNQKILSMKPLESLRDYDPKIVYKAYPGMVETKDGVNFNKQMEMGKVSNLITDMTIKGASYSDISKAVKHSMTIIDADKHNLNWRQSAIDNDIALLKKTWQGGANKGASTLISKASSRTDVPERKDRYTIDEKTGEKVYFETDKKKKKKVENPDGTFSWIETDIPVTQESTKMAEVKDAFALSSGTDIENIFAKYANSCKALGNEARKEYISTPSQQYDRGARKTYADEYKTLQSKLNQALLNAPNERKAQLMTDKIVDEKVKANPDLKKDKDAYSKIRTQTLAAQRTYSGAKKNLVDITDREWEAIQAGAITQSMLDSIMMNTDLDKLKERAIPIESKTTMNAAKIARAKSYYNQGYTQAEIADALGVSVSTVSKALKDI